MVSGIAQVVELRQKRVIFYVVNVFQKDGNHYNNKWSNILLGTFQENSLDIPSHVRKKNGNLASQKAREFRKYKDDLLDDVFRDRYLNKFSYKDLTAKYGIPKSSLSFLFKNSLFSKQNKDLVY